MQISELSHVELLSLIGLAKVMIRADRETSDEEFAAIQALAEQVEDEDWGALIAEARDRFRSRTDVLDLSATLERQAARNLIYRELYRLAAVDEIVDAEALLLHELAALWDIVSQPV